MRSWEIKQETPAMFTRQILMNFLALIASFFSPCMRGTCSNVFFLLIRDLILYNYQKLLCMYAFPQCSESVGLPLCYEDCMAVRQEFCLVDWALIEENKKRKSYIRSRGHFTLPDCESLPRISQTTATCSNAHLTDMNPELITRKIDNSVTFVLRV